MAKHTINHTCGHESEVNLVGPHEERDRKIEWLEGQQCWRCRKDAEFAAAQADTSPVIATIRPRLAIREGAVGVVVLFEGGCYNRRDELKSAGAIYSEPGDMGGIFGLLGTSRPSKCWHITATLTAAQVVELVEGGKARTITAATIWRTIAAMVGVPADIEVRSADEAGDLRVLADGVEMARRLLAAPAFASKGRDEIAPGSRVDGREAIEDHVRRSVNTAFHPVGTCAMGPGGVVSHELKVHGLEGLRIAALAEVAVGRSRCQTLDLAVDGHRRTPIHDALGGPLDVHAGRVTVLPVERGHIPAAGFKGDLVHTRVLCIELNLVKPGLGGGDDQSALGGIAPHALGTARMLIRHQAGIVTERPDLQRQS